VILGDVIVEVAGLAVKGIDDLLLALDRLRPGQEVEVSLIRDGQPLTVAVELGLPSR